jgi:hypothetical protein
MRLVLLAAIALLSVHCVVGAAPGYGRSFESFEELRNTRPTATGEVVFLVSHLAGNFKGGGQFVGTLSSGTNDWGMVASNGSTFRWNRQIEDYETLNVLHFGAVHDGITDDKEAVLRMINWSKAQSGGLAMNGVRFVQGIIKISPIDLFLNSPGNFALFGPTSPSARGPYTTIISDGSDAPVFNISSRRLTIRGIKWDGQATATVGDDYVPTSISNRQIFLHNNETAGQFVNVAQFYATRTGGTVFSLQDTLDTKFENIETNNTFSNFWNITWSYDPIGNWDHSTAVEATNMYITNSYGDGMLSAPRMAQGLLRNIWIKHCLNPGTFENSQWVIDNFRVEDCKEPFNYLSNREISQNVQLINATITRGGSTRSWLSAYEAGYTQNNNFGVTVKGALARLWRSSLLRGSNDNYDPVWLKVGTFQTRSLGGIWRIEVLSKVGYQQAVFTRPTANGSGGKTIISLQRGSGSDPILTVQNEGFPAVLSARYTDATNESTSLWIQIAPFCGEYAVFIKGSGPARLNSADVNSNFFTIDGTTQLQAPSDSTDALLKVSIHNGAAGFGAERGILTVDTISNQALVPGALAGYMMQKVNGKNVATPYFHLNPMITANASPLSSTIASGSGFTLTVSAQYAVSYQWRKGTVGGSMTDIVGATSSRYAVAAATTNDAGLYQVLVLGSEGLSTAVTSRNITVTITV